jgi:hypothetical protein
MSPDWANKPEAVPYSSLGDPQSLNLFGYVGNNPLSRRDPDGHCPWCLAVAGGGVLADESPLVAAGPVGWAVIGATALGIGGYALYEHYHQQNTPAVPFPGFDPTVAPNDQVGWRGKGDHASGKGSWVNPNTGEVYHPDLNHPLPIGPHWDYTDAKGKQWRLYPDGRVEPKPAPAPKPKPQPNPTPNPDPNPNPNPTPHPNPTPNPNPNPTSQPDPTSQPTPTPKPGVQSAALAGESLYAINLT